MPFDFDDDFDQPDAEWSKKDMDEKLRRAREAIRNEGKDGSTARGNDPAKALSLSTLEELVMYCIDTENFTDGRQFSVRLIEIMPYSSDAWQKHGQILAALGENNEALAAFDSALGIDPFDSATQINRAVVLGILKRTSEALAVIDSVMESDPTNTATSEDALFARANILQNAGRFEEAMKIFKYLARDNNGSGSGSNNDDDDRHADVWYDLAYCYDLMGKHSDALAAYQKHIDIEPYSYNAWYNCGVVCGKMGRFYDAIKHYDMAIAIKADFVAALYNRGNTYASLSRLAEAIESYKEALLHAPDDLSALYNLGNAHHEMGDFREAINAYTLVVSKSPDYYEAYFSRGTCYDAMDMLQSALDDYQKATSIKPDYSDAWYAQAEAFYNLEAYTPSVVAYRKALSYNPDDYECWFDYAELALEIGELDAAQLAYEKALSLVPSWAEAAFGLAKTHAARAADTYELDALRRERDHGSKTSLVPLPMPKELDIAQDYLHGALSLHYADHLNLALEELGEPRVPDLPLDALPSLASSLKAAQAAAKSGITNDHIQPLEPLESLEPAEFARLTKPAEPAQRANNAVLYGSVTLASITLSLGLTDRAVLEASLNRTTENDSLDKLKTVITAANKGLSANNDNLVRRFCQDFFFLLPDALFDYLVANILPLITVLDVWQDSLDLKHAPTDEVVAARAEFAALRRERQAQVLRDEQRG
jgi:tetratricopeptide (TPR) repeat protein